MRIVHKPLILGLGIAAAAAVIGASAQTPAGDTRPVTPVVPIAAGGGVDTIGRIFAAQLAERLNTVCTLNGPAPYFCDAYRPGRKGIVSAD